MLVLGVLIFALSGVGSGQSTLVERAGQYLADLIRLDTSNPPGNESRVANYLKSVAEREGIACETLGPDPSRLNFVARLAGSGKERPLLLMAHSDTVPAEASAWTAPPFSAIEREGFIYGRGALDDKSLLAAELAVLVELKRSNQHLDRDVILLAESDEEDGSSGIQWMIRNAWNRIDAEFALNEGGFAVDLPSGVRVHYVQTAEKVPMPVLLRARGTAGHGSLPRPDNAVLRLARALVALAEADQPVRLNATTRRFLAEISRLAEYAWLAPMLKNLERTQTAVATANRIRERDPEIDAQLRSTVTPTMLSAGTLVNVVPGSAEARVDVRRLPNESREEVTARLRRVIHDSEVQVLPMPGHDMPATPPSSADTALYRHMEAVLHRLPGKSLAVPFMQRGGTDGSFLRQKGMAVYGAPLFLREDREGRAHGNDERISASSLQAGSHLLWEIVCATVE